MKRNPMLRLSGLGLCWLLMLVVPLCAQSLSLTQQEKDWIKVHPTIRVANETDWPPFDFAEEGNAQGYSIDLIQLIAEKVGLQIEFVTGPPWSELLTGLYSGQIDVLPAVYYSPERAEKLALTQDYFSQPSVMVVKKSTQSIERFEDLAGKRVAGVEDFVITRTLETDFPEIDIQTYPGVLESLKAVSIGKVDAYIDSIGLVAFALEHNFVPNLKIIGDISLPEITSPPLYMGVRKEDTLLLSILNKGLSAVSEIEQSQLAKKWLNLHNYDKRITFTREQARWIRKNPILKVGLDPDYPPYSFVDNNGVYAGILVDILELLSEKTSIEFDMVPNLQWRDILHGIAYKSLDMAAPVVQTEQRNEYMLFSQPVISSPLVIMSRSDNHSIKGPDDLAYKTLALVEGYSSSQRIKSEHPSIETLWVKTPLEGLQAVSTGKADAFVGVIGVNIYLSQQQGINNLQVAGTYDLHFDGQRFAFPSNKTQLALLINKAIEAIDPEQLNAIRNRWISVPDTRTVDYSLLWKIIAAFSFIVLILYLYSRRLSREINQRELAEQQLMDSNLQLTVAKNSAERANNSKSKFVTTVSHELKTPLNAIIGFSDLLQRQNTLAEDDQDCLNHILDAGQHLNTLIDELLDLAKIEAGKLQLQTETVDLQNLIEESLNLMQITAHRQGITLQHVSLDQASPLVTGDPLRVKQIILNLLSNAIKYHREQGRVDIGFGPDVKGYIQVFVRDNGPGIAKDQQKHLFDYLERAGAEYSSVKGSGVGLSLCKHLVEMMQGEIGFNSEEGQGSTFWFTLPAAKDSRSALKTDQ